MVKVYVRLKVIPVKDGIYKKIEEIFCQFKLTKKGIGNEFLKEILME
jgi:hypothetical protein